MTDVRVGWGWRTLQGVVLITTFGLLAGLVWRPLPSLNLLWNVAIPLVPASLLLSPLLWRNVCPLATLNMAGNRVGLRRRATPGWMARANFIGILLFAILVPARRFLFNENGPILALVIAAVAATALALGFVFDGRAGFCNAICPVLPVERLYGQKPVVGVERARCSTCAACGRACLDLAPERSVLKVAKGRAGPRGWLLSPLGAFAASLPGFVLGYFTLPDGPLSSAGSVYGWIALTSGGSYAIVFVVNRLVGGEQGRWIRVCAAVAVATYYWFASPSVAAAIGGAPVVGQLLRVAAFALIAWWLYAALTQPTPGTAAA